MRWLLDRLSSFDDRIAIHEAGKRYTFTEFTKLIEQAANRLPPEGRQLIPIESETTAEGLALLFAIAVSGHIALPLPQELPEKSKEKMLQVAMEADLYERLNSSGLVLFSSGTSGQPKGMLHNLDALLHRYTHIRPRADRCLLLLLIDHIGGLDTAFRCLFSGSTLVIPEARTPEMACVTIEQFHANILPASPTFLNLLLLSEATNQRDLSSLEIIAYGAESMPQSLLNKLAARFPDAQLQQKFGTSETGAIRIKSQNKQSLFFRIDDSDTEWKIVDDELWLRTPSRILGYLNANDDGLEAEGWYATGDIVEADNLGNIRVIGRASSVINVGGQKVHPSEVETVLQELPEIDAVVVHSKPDAITGQAVACILATKSKRSPREWKRAIRSECRGKLSTWMIPSSVEIVEEFELNRRLKRS